MKNLRLKTLFVILIASAFMMSNSVGIAAVSQTGTTKQKKKEEIKPPDGEKWYEEGDEELYKFDIHPVTPKEGITGGYLIYYGHFVKPPYKIEVKDGKIYVNNLPVEKIPDELDKKLKEREAKRYKKTKRTEEEEKYFKKHYGTVKEIMLIKKKVMDKYKSDYEKHKKEIDSEIIELLKKHPDVIDFKYYDIYNLIYKTKIDNYWQGITSRPGRKHSEEELVRIKQKLIITKVRIWKRNLARDIKYVTLSGTEYIDNSKILLKISKIQKSELSIFDKIKGIQKLADLLHVSSSKLLYYNINLSSFLEKKHD